MRKAGRRITVHADTCRAERVVGVKISGSVLRRMSHPREGGKKDWSVTGTKCNRKELFHTSHRIAALTGDSIWVASVTVNPIRPPAAQIIRLGREDRDPQTKSCPQPHPRRHTPKIDTGIMKILESQSATLTNFEVYQHLLNEQQKAKLPDRKRQVPRSLQTVIKEVRPDASS